MILVKNYKSKDDTDNYYLGYGKEHRIIGKLSFSDNAWTKIIDSISEFINGKSNLFEFQCNKYDNVKLDIEINGRRRTINLHNIEKCSVIESIPNEIKNNKGYADISKLLQHIEKIAFDYISEMTLEIK